jgi:hypothetical protein
MSTTSSSRPHQSDRKADWADYVRSLDPHGNQGDPDSMTKDDLIGLAEELEAQAGAGPAADPAPTAAPEPAGTPAAGETRTAQRVGTGNVTQAPGGAISPDLGGYHTEAAAPPARASHQRSATTSAVTDRAPETAEILAGEQTPATSERIMGLPDSPKAAETGQGH